MTSYRCVVGCSSVVAVGLQQAGDVQAIAPAAQFVQLQDPDGRLGGADEEEDGELEPAPLLTASLEQHDERLDEQARVGDDEQPVATVRHARHLPDRQQRVQREDETREDRLLLRGQKQQNLW